MAGGITRIKTNNKSIEFELEEALPPSIYSQGSSKLFITSLALARYRASNLGPWLFEYLSFIYCSKTLVS
jgi:hypothetical protein